MAYTHELVQKDKLLAQVGIVWTNPLSDSSDSSSSSLVLEPFVKNTGEIGATNVEVTATRQ